MATTSPSIMALWAAAMEAVETHIMRKLGYTDPYEVTEVKPQHG